MYLINVTNIFSFLKIANKLNELSFTYAFDHVLINIMCKFNAFAPFYLFVFSPESQPSRIKIFAKVCPWNLPKSFTWVIWFINIIIMDFNMYLSKPSWNTHFLFKQHSPRWQPLVSYVSYHSLSALKCPHIHTCMCFYFAIMTSYI